MSRGSTCSVVSFHCSYFRSSNSFMRLPTSRYLCFTCRDSNMGRDRAAHLCVLHVLLSPLSLSPLSLSSLFPLLSLPFSLSHTHTRCCGLDTHTHTVVGWIHTHIVVGWWPQTSEFLRLHSCSPAYGTKHTPSYLKAMEPLCH